MQEGGAFLDWAFHGGTALRFLYSIPRCSEDLDFALIRTGRPSRFRELLEKIRASFEMEGYAVTLKINDSKTVASAFVRFPGLLYELGVSPHRPEVISVKIELDTNPPSGAVLETTLIRRHVVLNLLHHDRASLLAGTLHTVLTRGYTKGRDLYDLVWYLADRTWPSPNLLLLNSALLQTGWEGPRATEANWRELAAERIRRVRWDRAVEDVRPFLERQSDLTLLNEENCLKLLRRDR
ncbi:MAG: nucleotidyl transferase AbiEii/AbiGii toxin family protein [Candidatus Aureabacteria bacterium]|nr:nucleotidyl transferase AbiEii/AbiGii toxin family protein [Candidatus Auribacterota bacterium]